MHVSELLLELCNVDCIEFFKWLDSVVELVEFRIVLLQTIESVEEENDAVSNV